MDREIIQRLTETLGEDNFPSDLVAHFPRIAEKIVQTWGTPLLAGYLNDLLFDLRGDRQGFPDSVMQEIFRIHSVHNRLVQQQGNIGIWDYVEPVNKEMQQSSSPENRQAFFDAARSGELDDVRRALEAGQAVNQLDEEGHTPFWWSAFHDRTEVCEYLLHRGASVSHRDSEGRLAVHWFALHDNVPGLQLIDRFSGKIDVQDIHGQTPLMLAAGKGRVLACGWLLNHGADVALKDSNGRTALHHAAEAGRRRVIELLLGLGASGSEPDAKGETPLDLALKHPDFVRLEMLFKL